MSGRISRCCCFSILDLLESGQVKQNEITLSPELVKTFRHYFDAVRQKDDTALENLSFLKDVTVCDIPRISSRLSSNTKSSGKRRSKYWNAEKLTN